MKINPDVRSLFHELAGLSLQERNQFFEERAIDPQLRVEVESLLSYDTQREASFEISLESSVSGMANDLLSDPQASVFWPYQPIRQLGSGGMGTVYLAERSDGEIRQQVAIKLLRAEGFRPAWRERFLRERQLQATLNHTAIAQVRDAGHTRQGQPYLVMEYVDGKPLDEYAAPLPLHTKLRLFLQVCDGVSHAHRHLIIHRDLKPSNILVDQSGQPKILDFGIAKLLDESADATQTSERLLTPNYASPEQLRGVTQTTATDVYSLGAVLYKLLTNRSPHESDTGASVALEVITGARQIVSPSRQNRDLPSDLDYILKKALRLEPEERYESVDAFAVDIRDFLNARPVSARAGDSWYRLRIFLKRRWLPVAAVALTIAGLSTGLYVANRSRIAAEKRFQQLRRLSNKVFELDRAIRDLPGATTARLSLVSASLEYLEGLAPDAKADPELAREIGEGYWRVATIQSNDGTLSLGQFAQAEASLQKADAMIKIVLTAHPSDRTALFRSANIAGEQASQMRIQNRNSEAIAFMQETGRRLDRLDQIGITAPAEIREASYLYGELGREFYNLDKFEDAARLERRSAELARQLPKEPELLKNALSILANVLRYQGDMDGSDRAIREARQAEDRVVYPNETQRMIGAYGILLREGMILGEDGNINLGRPVEAAAAFQKAVDLLEQAAQRDPKDYTSRDRLALVGMHLGNILRHEDSGRALVVYDLALRRAREIRNTVALRRQARLLAESAYALRRLNRSGEARLRLDQSLELLKETKDYPAAKITIGSLPYFVLCASADQLADDGNPVQAAALFETILRLSSTDIAENTDDFGYAPLLSRLYEGLARSYGRSGDNEKLAEARAKRAALWSGWSHRLPQNPFVLRQMEGEATFLGNRPK